MGAIISRIKENQKIRENQKIKKQKVNIRENYTVEQSRSKNCLKMLRRDKRAEKIYEEIRQREDDDNCIEV
tara:strand:- start:603 stop:815 length:213 start_codon:yes stop_codon:yes gene_type:complete